MSSGPKKGCVALLWPDGRVRIATERALRERSEFFRRNNVKKYDGPWPPPMNDPKPEQGRSSIIVPDYLEPFARETARLVKMETEDRKEIVENEDAPGDDQPDEEDDCTPEEGSTSWS